MLTRGERGSEPKENYQVWHFLNIIKDTAVYGGRIEGRKYPLIGEFAGVLPKEHIPLFIEELNDLRTRVIGRLGWVQKDITGNFISVNLDPARLIQRRVGFAGLLPNFYEKYPQLAITDFLLCLLNDCNEAVSREDDLRINMFSSFPKPLVTGVQP